MLSSWEHRDEDTVKASAQGVGSVLTAARRTIGEGRAIPSAGTAWSWPSGWVEAEVLDWLQKRLDCRGAPVLAEGNDDRLVLDAQRPVKRY